MTSFGWWHQSGSPSFKVIPNGFEGGPKLAFRVIYSKIVVVFTGAQKSCWEVPRKYSRSIWMFFRISKMYKPKCSKFLSRVFSPESRLFSPESRLFLPELKSAKSAKNCPDRIFEGYEILIFGVYRLAMNSFFWPQAIENHHISSQLISNFMSHQLASLVAQLEVWKRTAR